MGYTEDVRLARMRKEMVRELPESAVDQLVRKAVALMEHRMGPEYVAKHDLASRARALVETRNAKREAWNLADHEVADALTPDCRYWKKH